MLEDDLSAASFDELGTQFIGRRVNYFPSLPSTMETARSQARQGAPQGTVVIAGEQTAGKGRMKRAWLSPAGGVALSIILYPDMDYLPGLIMVASLAVVGSIREVTGLSSQVKWPNDVLIGGKKVSGILIESGVRGGTVDYAVIGIGINANLRAADLADVSLPATSLSDELGKNVSRPELIVRLLVETERLYRLLKAGGRVYEQWRDSLVTLGKEVSVTSGDAVYHGIAESVARDGSLRLRREDGSLATISAGDVTLRYLTG